MNYLTKEEIKRFYDKYKAEYKGASVHKLAKIIINHEGLNVTHDSLRKKLMRVLDSEIKINKDTAIFPERSDFCIDIPDTIYNETEAFSLPKKCKRILVISDAHVPFHDSDALKLAFKYGNDKGIDTILLNGDFADVHSLSWFNRNPLERHFFTELQIVRETLQNIRRAFPMQKIYFKLGNHEARYEQHLNEKSFELQGVDDYEFRKVFRLDENNIEYIQNKRLIKAGKLTIAHGDEFYGKSGSLINIARMIRLKSGDNVLFGHFHKTQEDITTTISNKTIGAWSAGCLCGLKPKWLQLNFWNHGFAIVEVSEDGSFEVFNKKIIMGRIA